jgi:hypothetical protein
MCGYGSIITCLDELCQGGSVDRSARPRPNSYSESARYAISLRRYTWRTRPDPQPVHMQSVRFGKNDVPNATEDGDAFGTHDLVGVITNGEDEERAEDVVEVFRRPLNLLVAIKSCACCSSSSRGPSRLLQDGRAEPLAC